MQMSQVFFCIRAFMIRRFCFSRVQSRAAWSSRRCSRRGLQTLHFAGCTRCTSLYRSQTWDAAQHPVSVC